VAEAYGWRADLLRGVWASDDRENGRVKQRRQSEANDSGGHEWDEGIDVEVAGGVA
jgi:hypothetical protein